jgi:hypothetical protein
VNDRHRNPLTGSTVQLIEVVDSVSQYSSTDINGVAKFENVSDGLYVVMISYIGFESLEKTISIKPDDRNFEFKLNENSIALDEVTITAQKPFIRQEDDKMIIDPEPIASLSTNTLEVLESTPGLYVDQDGGIYINGATPAVIFINGREQKMSSQDITNLLQSLPPGSVERIEIMRTPSSKYDAASTGGIINVVLKKGVKIGRFGSVNLGMNQGVLGNRRIGASFNSGSDKSSYYINVNYSRRGRYQLQSMERMVDSLNTLFQNTTSYSKNDQLYLGYGISYDLNDKINVSYDGRFNGGVSNNEQDGDGLISDYFNDTLMNGLNSSTKSAQSLGVWQDLGMKISFDTLGSELDVKLSYSYGNNNSELDYLNTYSVPIYIVNQGLGNNFTNRHFVLLQSDLIYKFPLRINFETGVKSSFQEFDSNGEYFFNQDNELISDDFRNSKYRYIENINSAYAQVSKTFGEDLVVKAGVRVENTLMKGEQTIPADTGFVVNRTDFFPYVYISRKVIKIMGAELRGFLIYRRTINRPDYESLNPYISYVNDFMYEAGNPALKPQFTNNIEANISFNEFPVFAVGRNYTYDIFSSVIYQDDEHPEQVMSTYDNLGKSKETYLRGMLGIPPGGRYFFALGAQFNLNEYDGVYENEPLNYTRGSWRFFTFHALKLFENTKITMSGFMLQNGMYNFLEFSTFGQLNFGITQTFFDDKLTLSVGVRDVLYTRTNEFEINQGSVFSKGSRETDSRRFGIKIRYNFGIQTKKERNEMFKFTGEE